MNTGVDRNKTEHYDHGDGTKAEIRFQWSVSVPYGFESSVTFANGMTETFRTQAKFGSLEEAIRTALRETKEFIDRFNSGQFLGD